MNKILKQWAYDVSEKCYIDKMEHIMREVAEPLSESRITLRFYSTSAVKVDISYFTRLVILDDFNRYNSKDGKQQRKRL